MSKIFGVGLGRTGTKSLARAMKILGYKTKHAPRYIDIIKEVDFANDIFVAGRYKFLDFVYPDAKWILTIRDIDSWLNSMYNLRGKKLKKNGKGMPLRRAENSYLTYGITHYDETIFKYTYVNHYKKITEYFKDKPLLIMNICEGDGWEILCPFLEKDIPNIPFPHYNKQEYNAE